MEPQRKHRTRIPTSPYRVLVDLTEYSICTSRASPRTAPHISSYPDPLGAHTSKSCASCTDGRMQVHLWSGSRGSPEEKVGKKNPNRKPARPTGRTEYLVDNGNAITRLHEIWRNLPHCRWKGTARGQKTRTVTSEAAKAALQFVNLYFYSAAKTGPSLTSYQGCP